MQKNIVACVTAQISCEKIISAAMDLSKKLNCKLISDKIDAGLVSQKLLPNRITLLDPFYSKGEKSYLNNKWTGEVCREYVTYLKEKNVVFEEGEIVYG